ncbi:MAG: hypothetical protein JXA61_01690 [Bacteroidales bacterium]|nr:hypothetical protein [Bacteroidales bacterium]
MEITELNPEELCTISGGDKFMYDLGYLVGYLLKSAGNYNFYVTLKV